MEGDDRTFRANFTSEGVKVLRKKVEEKLKEFMGDYTDDTLVEYVIVLLKNGRRKDEAMTELNVFLGDDDSDSFVNWLWDHLGSSLNLYVQSLEPRPEKAPETKSSEEPARRMELQDNDSETDRVRSKREVGNGKKKESKHLVKDADAAPFTKSSMDEVRQAQDDSQHRVARPRGTVSPRHTSHKKRMRPEEREHRKREVSRSAASAPRRLLQFALRDAAATSRPSNTSGEPSPKRLRSVVSTKMDDPVPGERLQRTRLVSGMSAAIKAVEAAAKDVSNVRQSCNVFDRLGRGVFASDTPYQQEVNGGNSKDETYPDSNGMENSRFAFHRRDNSNKHKVRNTSSFNGDTTVNSALIYNGEGIEDANLMGLGARNVTQAGTSGGKRVKDSLVVHSGDADGFDQTVNKPHKDLDQPATYGASVTNGSAVSANNQAIAQYQNTREAAVIDSDQIIQDSDTVTKSKLCLVEKINEPTVDPNSNVKDQPYLQHEPPTSRTLAAAYSTGPSTDDADLRTIFISNVHFAATNDALSRHCNKFGGVLKVTILTDSATGQPKGSAYVEFVTKEAAEHALSLDSTSFMSRILKVVKKGAAQPEPISVMAWPRVARASTFVVPRYSRAPFPRGIPGIYRSRTPFKPGGRSFQWKRGEAQPTVSDVSTQSTRHLTYVRTEPKTEVMTSGSSGVA